MFLNRFFIGFLISTLTFSAFALESDVSQPIEIEADRMQLDEKSGITRYEGNVKMKQGSLSVTANLILLTTINSKLDHIKVTGTQRQPATFQQTTESGQLAHGQSLKMDLYVAKSRLVLMGQAELTQGSSSIRSERIDYNTLTNNLLASKSANQKSDPSGDGRVHIIITPDQL